MKRIPGSIAAVAIIAATSLMLASSAEAAAGTISVKSVPGQTAKYHRSVTVKPKISTRGNVVVVSKTFTIKKGKKTVVKNKTSAKLKAGSYKVKTTARYKSYVVKSSIKTTKTLVATAGTMLQARCIVSNPSDPNGTESYFDLLCTGNFDGSFTQTGYGYLPDSSNYLWSLGDGHIDGGPTAMSLVGKTFSGVVQTPVALFRSVSTTRDYRSYSAVKTKTKSQTLKIRQGKKPASTSPNGWNCPSWAPIKGNASSGIYHVPSARYYSRTNPEVCFSSESAARKAGYRKAKV